MAVSVPLRRLAPPATGEVGAGAGVFGDAKRGMDEDRRVRYF